MSKTIGQQLSEQIKEAKENASASAVDATFKYLVEALLKCGKMEVTVVRKQGMLGPRDVDNWIKLLLRLRDQNLGVEQSQLTVHDNDDRMPTTSQEPAYTVFVVDNKTTS